MNDTYGSVTREAMKRSMEQPAAIKLPNSPQNVPVYELLAFVVLVLWLGIMGLILLDKAEGNFRVPVVVSR